MGSTPVTTPLVKKVMEDTAKVMVDYKQDPTADTGEWELLHHNLEKQVVSRPLVHGKLVVEGKHIEIPKRRKKKKKKKTIEEEEEEVEEDPEEENKQDDEDKEQEEKDDKEEEKEEKEEEKEEKEEDDDEKE